MTPYKYLCLSGWVHFPCVCVCKPVVTLQTSTTTYTNDLLGQMCSRISWTCILFSAHYRGVDNCHFSLKARPLLFILQGTFAYSHAHSYRTSQFVQCKKLRSGLSVCLRMPQRSGKDHKVIEPSTSRFTGGTGLTVVTLLNFVVISASEVHFVIKMSLLLHFCFLTNSTSHLQMDTHPGEQQLLLAYCSQSSLSVLLPTFGLATLLLPLDPCGQVRMTKIMSCQMWKLFFLIRLI